MSKLPVILITRPEPGASDFARKIIRAGFQPLVESLSSVEFTPKPNANFRNFQAFLLTSANGVRALANQTDIRSTPLFAVGSRTADTAQKLGFKNIENANGSGEDLLQLIITKLSPSLGNLLHVSGVQVGFNLTKPLAKSGFNVEHISLYKVTPVKSLPTSCAAGLASGSISYATFFSSQSSKTFVQLVAKASLMHSITHTIAVAISPGAAEPLAILPWHKILIAKQPIASEITKLISEHSLNLGELDGAEEVQ